MNARRLLVVFAAALTVASVGRSSSALVPAGFHRTRTPNAQLLGSWRVTDSEVSGEKYPMTDLDIVWVFEPTQMLVRADGEVSASHYTLVSAEGGKTILGFGETSLAEISFMPPNVMVLAWKEPDLTDSSTRVYFVREP